MNKTLRRVVRRLMADRKKFTLMLGLLAVAMLLWGRLMLKQVPRTAVAGPKDQRRAQRAAGGGHGRVGGDKNSRAGGWSARETVYVDIPQAIARDVFAIDEDRYDDLHPPSQEPSGDPLEGKSGPEQADMSPRSDDLHQARVSLELQTTIMGPHPLAMINGRLLAPGQKIHGYVLRRVVNRRVVLERNGVEVQLGM